MYLITLLAHNIEWLEGANRTRRVGEERVPEPPKPDTLEKEMRKESEQYIEFVICMLPPVYGKEIWSEEVAEKQSYQYLSQQVKKHLHCCSTRMAMRHGRGCNLIHPTHRWMMMKWRLNNDRNSSTHPEQKHM